MKGVLGFLDKFRAEGGALHGLQLFCDDFLVLWKGFAELRDLPANNRSEQDKDREGERNSEQNRCDSPDIQPSERSRHRSQNEAQQHGDGDRDEDVACEIEREDNGGDDDHRIGRVTAPAEVGASAAERTQRFDRAFAVGICHGPHQSERTAA